MTWNQRYVGLILLLCLGWLLLASVMSTDHYVEDWMDNLPVGISEPTIIERTVP
ncbi:hypothetical protein [Zavarzinella formosa]|uniref:hypothetical protein n=1 Tax=Zavarzinella formosa TaxID=360055 RepID=UPI0002EE3B09|nr:hypothetical protein [Zavarzinella formosa]